MNLDRCPECGRPTCLAGPKCGGCCCIGCMYRLDDEVERRAA